MAINVRAELSADDYRMIAEGGHDWESWIAPDDSLRWTSPAGVTICGYSADECRAMNRFPWPLVLKEDHVTFELFDHYVGEQRAGNDLPVRIVRKDGAVIWVTASWQPLKSAAGEYQGVRVSIRDRSWSLHNRYLDHFRPVAIDLLAEIMPAARAGDMARVYRLTTERAARALGVERVGIWMFDDERQTLIAADRFSSLDHSHLEGSLLPLKDCPRYRAALTGDQLVVAPDAMNDPLTRELADFYLRPLGIASMLDAPIVRGGRTIGVICHEHVGHTRSWYETELAFAESLSDFMTLALYANEGTQLAERNRMLASIVEVLPDPVVTVGVDGEPVYINRAAYHTHEPPEGSAEGEFKVQNISGSYSAQSLKFREEVIVPAALQYGFWRGEVRLMTRQGTEIPVWQTMVAHRDRFGELKLLTSILRDLRDQKAVETRLRASEAELQRLNAQLEARVAESTRRLEQRHQELEAFSASVAQDLEIALRAIDGDSRRVLEEFGALLPEGARSLVQELSGCAARLRTLTDALLLHSRTVRRPANPTRFFPGVLVEQELKALRRAGALTGVILEEQLEELEIETDAEFFVAIVRNLLDNAIKFASAVAQPAVRITLCTDDQGLQFTVADNGAGFDTRGHDALFGLFDRRHSLDQYPGTGVGLAIVSEAALRMGGRVWVRSAQGQGAEITFQLPL